MEASIKVLTCGGFDPLHVGHLRLLQESAKLGELTVALNSDAWLRRKKGYVFMPWQERAEILGAYSFVHDVVPFNDSDGTACEAILEHHPDIFTKGGDRGPNNTPESDLCEQLGIDVIYGVGGGKEQSSSDLVRRQWGNYRVLAEGDGWKLKLLTVMPHKSTSVQKHDHREEHWVFAERGQYQFVRKGEVHQLVNNGAIPIHVVELQRGDKCVEEDIVRL